ncbi:MAG TPA: prepilin-type N-terminal cleavage/methylation domain-containing protein [Armatimonadota bacterium]|jgi:prepilin-type N-terminal cleavage/methylation domain-containing protein/prepilin-type processing-associated H-X9-DG protein
MSKKGFTLIELLVVIAIIAILAAILFPVFARARAKAQQSNCLSNMKQIALANAMYMSDNDQKVFTFGGVNGEWYLLNGAWVTCMMADLAPYAKNNQIFTCPSSNNDTPNGANYHINMCALTGGPQDPVNWVRGGNNPVKDSEMNAAAVMIAFDGFTGGRTWCTTGYGSREGDIATACTSDLRVSDRHNGGANVNFYDGHAKWMKLNAIWSTNAGVAFGDSCGVGGTRVTDASNRAQVGPNPWWTGSNES